MLDLPIIAGRLREYLFYRLNIFPLRLPALAERREDLPERIAHFLGQMDAETRFSPAAMRMLAAYDWPGNVRELRNVIERATILHPDAEVSAEDIELLIGAAISGPRAEERCVGQEGVSPCLSRWRP